MPAAALAVAAAPATPISNQPPKGHIINKGIAGAKGGRAGGRRCCSAPYRAMDKVHLQP